MRRAAKVDLNHAEIRDYLRAKGWSVLSLAVIGNGAPDLLVARFGWSALVEIKSSEKKKLNPAQQSFARSWRGVCIRADGPEGAERRLILAQSQSRLMAMGGT